MMKALGLATLLSLTAFACDGGGAPKADKVPDSAAKKAPEKAAEKAPEKTAEKAVAKVEVSKEGSKFNPPVKVEQLPDGVWYCDMGTAHYARTEKGDGKCPLCKMDLKQVAAKAK